MLSRWIFAKRLHLLFLVIIPGCTVLSTQIPGSRTSPLGTEYSLPVGIVGFSLSIIPATATFSLTIDKDPKMVPDENHSYILKYLSAVTADDTFTVKTKNSLLDWIEVTTDDRTDQIILEAVKSLSGALEIGGFVGTKAITFYKNEFNPTKQQDIDDTIERLNRLIFRMTRDIIKYNCKTPTESEQFLCTEYKRISIISFQNKYINLAVRKPKVVQYANAPKCDVGVCYRSLKAHRITYSIGNSARFSKVVLLPNSSPLVALDISRAAFVKKVMRLDFEDGILIEVHVAKPSELEALVKLPLTIAKALISVPTEIVKLRVNLDDAQAAKINSKAKLLQARQDAISKNAVLESNLLEPRFVEGTNVPLLFPQNSNPPPVFPTDGVIPGGDIIPGGNG